MEPERTLPHLQASATRPYPGPAQSNPDTHITLPGDPSSFYPPIYAWVSPVASFPPVSPPRPYESPLHSHTRHMSSISNSSTFYHPHMANNQQQLNRPFSH